MGNFGGPCMTHDLWHALNEHMLEFLRSITLQKMVDDQLAKGVQIEEKTLIRKPIATTPVLKPVRVNAPNSVFALGSGNFQSKS